MLNYHIYRWKEQNTYIYVYQKFAYFQNNVQQSLIYPEQLHRFKNQLYKHVLDLTREEKGPKKSLNKDLSQGSL